MVLVLVLESMSPSHSLVTKKKKVKRISRFFKDSKQLAEIHHGVDVASTRIGYSHHMTAGC